MADRSRNSSTTSVEKALALGLLEHMKQLVAHAPSSR